MVEVDPKDGDAALTNPEGVVEALLLSQQGLQLLICRRDLHVRRLELGVGPLELSCSLLHASLELLGEAAQLSIRLLTIGDLPDHVHDLG